MNADSAQLTAVGKVECSQDQPLLGEKQYEVLKEALQTVEKRTFSGLDFYVFSSENKEIILLTKAITYLGNPHPIFKKRIQIPKSWSAFCNEAPTADVRFLGIYHYEGNVIFVEFKKETYLKRKTHNSSAHVYINDLYEGQTYGTFEKTDHNKNRIVVIRKDKLRDYLTGGLKHQTDLLTFFERFNQQFPFLKWITAISAIKAMYCGQCSNWKETEWAGFFLEFLFANFCKTDPEATGKISYIGSANKGKKNKNIKNGVYDFDIYFIADNFYGDLKASDEKKSQAPGNDQATFIACVKQHKRFWYVIYEHATIKDSEDGLYLACKERVNFIKSRDPTFKKDETSYRTRMKREVQFKRMCIVELNSVNYHEILKTFKQGHQPSGKSRDAKFSINKKFLKNDNFVIFRYEA